MSSAKKIILKSSDGESFEVDEMVALESETIEQMIKDDRAGSGIPPLKVTSNILYKVIEYCKKHVKDPKPDGFTSVYDEDKLTANLESLLLRYSTKCDELKNWDAEFINVDHDTLFDLNAAAFYLNIKSLLDLTCQAFNDVIKGKTHDEMMKILDSQNELTPEEKEEIRRENLWTLDV